MIDGLSAAGMAQSIVASKTAVATQELAIEVMKVNMNNQASVADILTEASSPAATAVANANPSANSAITGRGTVLDIVV